MNRPSPTQIETAMRLLALEDAASSADDRAASAAGRVYDKLHALLAPLLGDVGVELLFMRSSKLVQGEFSGLAEVSILEGSAKLREHLQAQDPAIATESAASLFGTFFALITAMIGERLANQVLRSAWPTIPETAFRETPK